MTADLDPLQRLVLRELAPTEGTTTTDLARRVCQPDWEVRPVLEQLRRHGLIERGTGGWRLVPPDPAPAELDPWMTPLEIADRLRVSKMTVYRLLHSGDLRSVRVRQCFRVRRSWVLDYLRARHTGPETAAPAAHAAPAAIEGRRRA